MAAISPIVRAFGCSLAGSLDEIMERNTILSIPNTISRNVSVSKAIHALGNKNVSRISIDLYFVPKLIKILICHLSSDA